MPDYLIRWAPPAGHWIHTEAGAYRNVKTGHVTTLRADYVASLAPFVQLAVGGDEVALVAQDEDGLDLDAAASWTQANADGHFIDNPDGNVEVIAHWDGSGGGSQRVVSIAGTPDPVVLVLGPGKIERSGRLSVATHGDPLTLQVDAVSGVFLIAVDKEDN